MEATKQQGVRLNEALLHRSIHKLPVGKFIDCLCGDGFEGDGEQALPNLSALIIEGSPSPHELQSAWEEITGQYNDALQSDQNLYYYQALKSLAQQTTSAGTI